VVREEQAASPIRVSSARYGNDRRIGFGSTSSPMIDMRIGFSPAVVTLILTL
jgi:hypothetical protein